MRGEGRQGAGRDKEKEVSKNEKTKDEKAKTAKYNMGVWGDTRGEGEGTMRRCADVQIRAAELRVCVDASLDCGGNSLRFAACRTSKGRKKARKASKARVIGQPGSRSTDGLVPCSEHGGRGARRKVLVRGPHAASQAAKGQ